MGGVSEFLEKIDHDRGSPIGPIYAYANLMMASTNITLCKY